MSLLLINFEYWDKGVQALKISLDAKRKIGSFLAMMLIFVAGFLVVLLINQPIEKTISPEEPITNQSTAEAARLVNQELIENQVPDIDEALALYQTVPKQGAEVVEKVVEEEYAPDLLSNQPEIMSAINKTSLDSENLGYLFLPEHPAQVTDTAPGVIQLDVPLILQKHPKWRDVQYGVEEIDHIGDTGCAIATLAMVRSYFEDKEVTPLSILQWSQGDYFVPGAGTSWSIFEAFTQQFGYQMINHGPNFDTAMQTLDNNQLVVVSVKPGYFTSVGHILVIRGYDPENGLVYVNDPNDSPDKMFSIQGIDENIIRNESLNYWTFYK